MFVAGLFGLIRNNKMEIEIEFCTLKPFSIMGFYCYQHKAFLFCFRVEGEEEEERFSHFKTIIGRWCIFPDFNAEN